MVILICKCPLILILSLCQLITTTPACVQVMTGCIVKLRGLDSIELNDCGGHVRGKSLTLLYRPIGPYLESMADFCSECLSDVQC